MVILAAVGEKNDQSQVIETAYSLATAYGDQLQVLHVIPEEEAEKHFNSIQSIPEFEDLSFQVENDRAEEIADKLIQQTLPDNGDTNISPIGRTGEPADEILRAADTLKPRFLVIGGRKRTPVGKAVFGSVTQSVILDSSFPVVAVMTES